MVLLMVPLLGQVSPPFLASRSLGSRVACVIFVSWHVHHITHHTGPQLHRQTLKRTGQQAVFNEVWPNAQNNNLPTFLPPFEVRCPCRPWRARSWRPPTSSSSRRPCREPLAGGVYLVLALQGEHLHGGRLHDVGLARARP